jgi:hypothetical protein
MIRGSLQGYVPDLSQKICHKNPTYQENFKNQGNTREFEKRVEVIFSCSSKLNYLKCKEKDFCQ